jgi:predicted dehydrogenase
VYNDFRELLARDEVDAILNATPDHWHVLIALEAARQGKDMYHEKPLGMSVEEGKVLRSEIQHSGSVFQFGTQQRSSYNFRFACELARNRRLGELKRVVLGGVGGGSRGNPPPVPAPEPVPAGFDYDMWLGPAPWSPYCNERVSRSWMGIRDYCLGGISGAWGIHDVDIAQWVCDADDSGPIEVEGTGEIPSDGLSTAVSGWTVRHTYASGVEMLHMDAQAVRDYTEQRGYPRLPWMGVMFIGTEGWVFASRQRLIAEPQGLLGQGFSPDDVRLYYSNNHAQNFIDCVKSRKRTICPIESAVRSDTVCHLDDITIRLGRKLRWDPVKEEVVGDDEANRMLSRSMRAPWHL